MVNNRITSKDMRNWYLENVQDDLQKKAISEYEKKEAMNESYKSYEKHQSLKENALLKARKYETFCEKVTAHLMCMGIKKIFHEALDDINGYELKNNDGVAYINAFIQENGGSKRLLTQFKSKSLILSELAMNVDKYSKIIKEKADKNDDSTFIISPEDEESFLSDIESAEADKCIEAIRNRVGEAIDSFINKVKEDKEKIQEVISKFQPKIEDEEASDAVKENASLLFKKEMNAVKNSRAKSIYEHMVSAIAKSSYSDPILKEQFLSNDNRLNMDSVMESATVMYTFLETLNTCKMVAVDESYLKKLVKDLEA